MTNNQADELLRDVLVALGEIKGLLAERLPKSQPTEVQPSPKTAVVTGEGSRETSNPSITAKKQVPGRRR